MSLIKCAECGGMVSNRAVCCPHCGYPMATQTGTVCAIDGVQYDLAQILELSKRGHVGAPRGEAWSILVGGKIIGDDDFWELWEIICKTQQIPPTFNHGDQAKAVLIAASPRSQSATNLPKCPVCGSTNLVKQGVAGRAVSGFIFGGLSVEGRAQWICKNCGHMF